MSILRTLVTNSFACQSRKTKLNLLRKEDVADGLAVGSLAEWIPVAVAEHLGEEEELGNQLLDTVIFVGFTRDPP